MQLPSRNSVPLPIGAAATLACLYEALACKPGNVYPGADFDETTSYAAFAKSAAVIGPIVEKTPDVGVGQTVLNAVRATRDAVATNTNLGTLLLIVPLAAVPREISLEAGIGKVIDKLATDDTRAVYEAIRIANAGGLGRADEADVSADPPPRLKLSEAMLMAADRDLVARQYTSNFHDVHRVAHFIEFGLTVNSTLEGAIILAYLNQLVAAPDSLIQRKLGLAAAQEASTRAASVLQNGSVQSAAFKESMADFDCWLRADGNRRNPGTTADLIAAGLFVLLREGRLHWSVW